MPNPCSTPTLAVVVPATDDAPTLPRCLAALGAAASEAEKVIVQREPPGAGPALARNLGVARSEAEVIVFVDADVLVHADALARIRAAFAADGELSAVFGAYDGSPEDPATVSRFRNLLHHHVHHRAEGPARTFWAGLGAVRRSAFESCGGFDAARFATPAVEDIELGARLAARGHRIRLDPRIRGTHLKRWTIASMLWTDFARRGVPWVRLMLEGRAPRTALNAGWGSRLSAIALLAAIAAALRARPARALAGLACMLAINRSFYALLARAGGPSLLAGGVVLHALHQLAAIASVPAALAAHLAPHRPRT